MVILNEEKTFPDNQPTLFNTSICAKNKQTNNKRMSVVLFMTTLSVPLMIGWGQAQWVLVNEFLSWIVSCHFHTRVFQDLGWDLLELISTPKRSNWQQLRHWLLHQPMSLSDNDEQSAQLTHYEHTV